MTDSPSGEEALVALLFLLVVIPATFGPMLDIIPMETATWSFAMYTAYLVTVMHDNA